MNLPVSGVTRLPCQESPARLNFVQEEPVSNYLDGVPTRWASGVGGGNPTEEVNEVSAGGHWLPWQARLRGYSSGHGTTPPGRGDIPTQPHRITPGEPLLASLGCGGRALPLRRRCCTSAGLWRVVTSDHGDWRPAGAPVKPAACLYRPSPSHPSTAGNCFHQGEHTDHVIGVSPQGPLQLPGAGVPRFVFVRAAGLECFIPRRSPPVRPRVCSYWGVFFNSPVRASHGLIRTAMARCFHPEENTHATGVLFASRSSSIPTFRGIPRFPPGIEAAGPGGWAPGSGENMPKSSRYARQPRCGYPSFTV